VTRVTALDYGSAREFAKLPQNRQGEAYRIARKMAARDRRSSPISRLVAKAVKKMHDEKSVGGDKTLKTGGHVALLIQNTKEERRLGGAGEGTSRPGGCGKSCGTCGTWGTCIDVSI